jgi:hypothetical protein
MLHAAFTHTPFSPTTQRTQNNLVNVTQELIVVEWPSDSGDASQALLIDRPTSCANCSLHLLGFSRVDVRASLDIGISLLMRTVGTVNMTATIRARNITVEAGRVLLSSGARITASGMGPTTANAAADTMLGPDGQIYGAGGGHSAGFGIKPSSNAVVGADAGMPGGYPANVADNYRQPIGAGLMGGTATPSADLILSRRGDGAGAGRQAGRHDQVGAERHADDCQGLVGRRQRSRAADLASVACKETGKHVLYCPAGIYVPEVALVGGGGGGGGAVWIDAQSILGEGVISANGGSVDRIPSTVNNVRQGRGVAGRRWRRWSRRPVLQRAARCQCDGARARRPLAEFTAYGTAGLVFIKNTKTFAEELVLDNGYDRQQNSWPATTLPAGPFAALTLKGAAIARADAALNVALLTMANRAQLRALTNSGDLKDSL